MSQRTGPISELQKTVTVLVTSIALIAVAFCIAWDRTTRQPTLRELYPWNIVQPEDPWYPALSHPDGREIINVVLTDWIGRVGQEQNAVGSFYEDPPDVSRVRLLRFQLPTDFVPSVSGAGFLLLNQTSDNRDDSLMGHKPGDIGLRFDWFEQQKDNSIRFVMCLLQYADSRPGIIGGWSIEYRVSKVDGRWVARFEMAIT